MCIYFPQVDTIEYFSELCLTKHTLLAETMSDSAAAAEHLETVIDGHCSGSRVLNAI